MYQLHALAALSAIPTIFGAVEMTSFPLLVSHLSPLITDTPPEAWTHNAWGSNTSSPNAKATFEAYGWTIRVDGRRDGPATWRTEPAYEPAEGAPSVVWNEGDSAQAQGGMLLRADTRQRDLRIREVILETPSTGANLSVIRLSPGAVLPGAPQ